MKHFDRQKLIYLVQILNKIYQFLLIQMIPINKTKEVVYYTLTIKTKRRKLLVELAFLKTK